MQKDELESLKVDQLRHMHKQLGLQYTGLNKAALVSNLLAPQASKVKSPRAAQQSEEASVPSKKAKRVKASADAAGVAAASRASKKVKSPRTAQQSEEASGVAQPSKKAKATHMAAQSPSVLAVLKYSNRYIVIVESPQTEIDNLPGVKDYNKPSLTDPNVRPCINMAFELSTGTSNEYNFPGVFLPILRGDSDGWLSKDGGIGGWMPFFIYDRGNRNIPVAVVYNYVLSKLQTDGHSEECMKRAIIFLTEFLDRFGTWKQLQVSASFGGKIWDEHIVSRYLREFVLQYNFMPYVQPLPETTQIIKSLLDNTPIPTEEYSKAVKIGDTLVQTWPGYRGALVAKQPPDRRDAKLRFYYSPNIIQRRVFDPATAIPVETPEELNKILAAHNALCKLNDSTRSTFGEPKKATPEEEAIRVERADRAKRGIILYDPVSKGWKDCGQQQA